MKKILLLIFMLLCMYFADSQVIKLETSGNYISVTDTVASSQYINDIPKSTMTYSFASSVSADSMKVRLYNTTNPDIIYLPKPGTGRWWDFSDDDIVNSAGVAFTRATLLTFLRQNSSSPILPTGTSGEDGYSATWDDSEGGYSLVDIQSGGGTDDQTATEVPFTPYSTIASSNVQAAIQELLDESGGGGGTDDQTIDVFQLSGTELQLSLESDGEATQTVELSSLQDGFEANTDAQDLTLTGNTLAISGDPNTDVDLSGYLDNTDTQLTEEQVEDFVGGMLGGTETGITVTYQDGTGDIDFVVDAETNDLSSSVTWANIPDANVPESSVTQHEGALTINANQFDPNESATASTATLTATPSNLYYDVTAQAAAITIAAPTGTWPNFQPITIRISDNGTQRTITWNAVFVGDKPSETTVGGVTYVSAYWNNTESQWDVVAFNVVQ